MSSFTLAQVTTLVHPLRAGLGHFSQDNITCFILMSINKMKAGCSEAILLLPPFFTADQFLQFSQSLFIFKYKMQILYDLQYKIYLKMSIVKLC